MVVVAVEMRIMAYFGDRTDIICQGEGEGNGGIKVSDSNVSVVECIEMGKTSLAKDRDILFLVK